MKIYDFRSDTITKPSEAMRKCMYEAEVGDNVYGEDETVNKLQDMACEVTGKEASLFVSSGTMGNLITLMILGGHRKNLITDTESHILHYELSGVASIASLMPVAVEADKGILNKDLVSKVIATNADYAMSNTVMIAIENTHNRAGGICYPIETLKELFNFSKENNIHFHIDGARIFNASVAQKISVKEITKYTDSVTFCLSKGLGAPVGSVLCGKKEFIEEAMSIRKLIGGGLRQSGIIAAAGVYALENNISDLEKDHKNAKDIANAINEGSFGKINVSDVETNIVICDTFDEAIVVYEKFNSVGVRTIVFGKNKLRFVTHRDLSASDVKETCEIIKNLKL